MKALQAGDDKKPAWLARKSCNYLTSVRHCWSLLVGECQTLQEMNNMRDEEMKSVLDMVKQNIPDWDSEKCPTVR